MLAADERAAVEESRQGSEQQLMAVRDLAARPGPRARRAGQLRPPRRDGPHPAEDAHRAARGARARGARPRPRRARRRLRPDQLVPVLPARCPTARSAPEPARRSSARSRRSGCAPPSARSSMLGRVNPLALEEFSALEERHKFLTEQLEDLKRTRKDLLDIVREVDERVEQVFTEAYADVEHGLRLDLRPALPRRRGPAGPHRPRRHAHHRHRGRGAPGRQEGQAALAALRRRALAGRGGASWSRSSRPGRRRSTSSTRSRPRSTTPTSAGCWRSTRSCARTPS